MYFVLKIGLSLSSKPQHNEHKATTSKRTSRLKRSITDEIDFCKRLHNYVSYNFKETRKTKLKQSGCSIRKNCNNFKLNNMTNLEAFIQKNPYKVFFIIIIICILADNF